MKPIPTPLLQPWPITQDGLQLVLSVWSRGGLFAEAREQALAARAGQPLENARTAYLRDGVCVIPVTGPLFRHATVLTELSGATAYGELRRDLRAALDDPECGAILFDIDSPGGEANALAELADAIYAARAIKPVWCYVGGYGASAAYWIASACDRVVVGETALLGSIGVRIVVVDDSGAEEKAGIRTVEIISAQSPGKRAHPVDDGVVSRLQARADQLAGIFVRDVARNRRTSVERVLSDFGQGDVVMGPAAVAAGMADALGDHESTVEALAAHVAQQRTNTPAPFIRPTGARNMENNPGATSADDPARADALAQFKAQVLTATGTATAEQALGRIAAGEHAIVELAEVRTRMASAEKAALARSWRETLDAALSGERPRLTLGMAARIVPTFLAAGARTSAKAALEALTAQTVAGVRDALCSVEPTAEALESLTAFVDAAGPALPAPKREPPLDQENRAAVASVAKEDASKYGLKPEVVERYHNVTSVDQLREPATAQKGI